MSNSDSDDELDDLIDSYPEIKVKLLWHLDYWNGPLTGVCEYDGCRCYFDALMSTAQTPRRYYRVVELLPEVLAALEKQHTRFQLCFGDYTDYDAKGKLRGTPKSIYQYKPTSFIQYSDEYIEEHTIGWFCR